MHIETNVCILTTDTIVIDVVIISRRVVATNGLQSIWRLQIKIYITSSQEYVCVCARVRFS